MPALIRHSDTDPLSVATAPPPDETPEQRAAREEQEARARAVSDAIDADLKAEKARRRKKQAAIKVLLLGQSESGKSTTVKNFQMAYAYSSFVEERSAWKAVVHLNLVRSVNTVLDVLHAELQRQHRPAPRGPRDRTRSRPHTPHAGPSSSSPPLPPALRASSSRAGSDAEALDADDDEDDDAPDADAGPDALPPHLRLLHLRLAPLRQVQADLERSLGAPSDTPPPPAQGHTWAAPWLRPKEFGVPSRRGWRSALKRVGGARKSRASTSSRDEGFEEGGVKEAAKRSVVKLRRPTPSPPDSDSDTEDPFSATPRRPRTASSGSVPTPAAAAQVIASCAPDIAALWADPALRALLVRRGLRLEEGSGFFLDDVARVASPAFRPSDHDVVRARLRTVGVQEYRFVFETGPDVGREWFIYDVGGARSCRHAWPPYFDDINALIFLAPISCFDERLAEDRKVNRLEDSLALWRAICASKLLRNVQMILFLNKCDLLHAKLLRGVRVAKTVPSYADRPNEPKAVARYFRQQFKDILIKSSPEPRGFYSFLTSVVDTQATAATVASVWEGIQRSHLKNADVI